jgi:hypothetical protein
MKHSHLTASAVRSQEHAVSVQPGTWLPHQPQILICVHFPKPPCYGAVQYYFDLDQMKQGVQRFSGPLHCKADNKA